VAQKKFVIIIIIIVVIIIIIIIIIIISWEMAYFTSRSQAWLNLNNELPLCSFEQFTWGIAISFELLDTITVSV